MRNRTSDVDIIKELRLRRWAREHYVSSAERSATWHPVVLEEMSRRDRELNPRSASPVGSRFVPLAPRVLHVHNAHAALPAPNFLARTVLAEVEYIPG